MSICRAVAAFLSGDLALTIEKLRTEMLRLARLRRFEEAGRFRDKIKNLKRLLQKQEAGLLFKRHEFKWAEEALALLKKTIKLDHDPKRIEAFDISNIMGKNMVGSMAVFENGLPRKSDYRRFMIRTVKEKPNDVAAIFEVVLRRYTGTLKDKLALPDLVLIDGGIAQVRSAKAALDAAGQKYLPVLGLAKKNEEIFLPEKNSPLLLGRDSPALQLLQRIRDEAHRFALKYHQQKRRLQSGN